MQNGKSPHTRHTRRDMLKFGLLGGTALAFAPGAFPSPCGAWETSTASALPKATWNKLPRWRGFNLLEKFMIPWNSKPFVENDFKWIRDFGFNFVRLPMDYRTWIVEGDWKRFNEQTLGEIDEALRFGEKYGIHVCMNFHRAPGYTVARPAEAKDLWSDPETQEVCALHWSTFAKRYKGVPSEQLSFNLFNEPAHVDPEKFMHVHRLIVAAIREEDPNRLIICDGNDYGVKPFLPLAELNVAQATRGYAPMEISHYRADWVGGSENHPMPTWPIQTINGLLLSPGKTEIAEESRRPLVVQGPFRSATKLRVRVGTVSSRTTLEITAGGNTIFSRDFNPGPGQGEWKTVVHRPEWNTYQNVYDRDYFCDIPAGTKELQLKVGTGDWISLAELGFRSETAENECSVASWGGKSSVIRYEESGRRAKITGGELRDRQWLKRTMIEPWQEAEKAGIGVVVGEFGCHNRTPHGPALAWLEDSLANWKEAGWGCALWNFRGSFGIMDSGRSDVKYEDFHGHKLDREMLALLQKYS